jgi:hypothetical protein
MKGFGPLERLDIQVGDICLAVTARQGHAHFKLGVQHHVVFPEPSRTIIDADDTLLHLHLFPVAAPRHGIVLTLFAARGYRAMHGDTTLAECESGAASTNSGFGDAVGVVTTPGVQR